MKKYILAFIAMLFSIALFLYLLITRISLSISYYNYYFNNPTIEWAEMYHRLAINCTILACFCFVAIVFNLFVIILFAFPVFKPLVDKHNARKQKRAEARAERAEADKQAKIEELERQLEELKKDE